MRALTLFLLTLSLAGPALAQLEPINPPAFNPNLAGAGASPTGRPSNTSGKIQIGYEKRSEYPNIKQPTGAKKPAATPAAAGNNAPNQNLDGDIFDPSQDPFANNLQAPQAAPAPTSAAAPTTAAPAKPRSDSALRSDSTPAKEAAATAKAEADKKAAADKQKADALAAAIAAAQKAGALPIKQ